MKHIFYLILIILTNNAFCESDSYWKCSTLDNTDKEWTAQSPYQKIALNLALEACKKTSAAPMSCKTRLADCEEFLQGRSTKPMWRCTALDAFAVPWRNKFRQDIETAALAAKAVCQARSPKPFSCTINLVTCKNLNDGNSL